LGGVRLAGIGGFGAVTPASGAGAAGGFGAVGTGVV
jgi:hypothetical protein